MNQKFAAVIALAGTLVQLVFNLLWMTTTVRPTRAAGVIVAVVFYGTLIAYFFNEFETGTARSSKEP